MIFSDSRDFYYVTNLEIEVESNNSDKKSFKGAFHALNEPGGVQLKVNSSKSNSAAAHEFGHWLGLTHTFKEEGKNNDVIVDSRGGTGNNFMDYEVTRTNWVISQIFKTKK